MIQQIKHTDLKQFENKVFYNDNLNITSTTKKTINNTEINKPEDIHLNFIIKEFGDYININLDYTFLLSVIEHHISHKIEFIISKNNLKIVIYKTEKDNKTIIKEKDFIFNTDNLNNKYLIDNSGFISAKFNIEFLNNLLEIFKHDDKIKVLLSHDRPLIITDLNNMGIIAPILENE